MNTVLKTRLQSHEWQSFKINVLNWYKVVTIENIYQVYIRIPFKPTARISGRSSRVNNIIQILLTTAEKQFQFVLHSTAQTINKLGMS